MTSFKNSLKIATAVAALGLTVACSSTDDVMSLFKDKPPPAAPAPRWAKTETGVVVMPTDAAAKKVRLDVMTDSIIRVAAAPTESLDLPKSLIVEAAPAGAPFDAVSDGEKPCTARSRPRSERTSRVDAQSGVPISAKCPVAAQ